MNAAFVDDWRALSVGEVSLEAVRSTMVGSHRIHNHKDPLPTLQRKTSFVQERIVETSQEMELTYFQNDIELKFYPPTLQKLYKASNALPSPLWCDDKRQVGFWHEPISDYGFLEIKFDGSGVTLSIV